MPSVQKSLALIVLLGAWTSSVHAQEAEPADRQPAGTRIYEVPKEGFVIESKLTGDDAPLAAAPVVELNGAPHQVFHVELTKGQFYIITLASLEFDAFLIVENGIGKRLAFVLSGLGK